MIQFLKCILFGIPDNGQSPEIPCIMPSEFFRTQLTQTFTLKDQDILVDSRSVFFHSFTLEKNYQYH